MFLGICARFSNLSAYLQFPHNYLKILSLEVMFPPKYLSLLFFLVSYRLVDLLILSKDPTFAFVTCVPRLRLSGPS